MAPDIETPFGEAIPPFPPHSITVHMPKWVTILQFIDNAQEIFGKVKSIYPRFGPFGYVKEFVGKLASASLEEGQAFLPFPSKESAEACREFALSENRTENPCEPGEINVRVFEFSGTRIWAPVFPASKMPAVIPFWQGCGTGMSSRFAKDVLDHYDSKEEPAYDITLDKGLSMDHSAFGELKIRISGLLNRSPVTSRSTKVSSGDVFLYPSGMAAIYSLHRYLQRSPRRMGSTVLFGFAFHSSPHVFKEYSPMFKWFGRGDERDLKKLEDFCTAEAEAERKVQAVWLEFPSNPNLRTSNLKRLRELADKFGFYIFVDDTISSFCNVDLFDDVDALVTSLTKSFSGYADLIAGSVVLNPTSKHYSQLKDICSRNFVNEFYGADADALERNSRDYLERSKRLNDNAFAVVEYLHSCVNDSSSAVSGVTYPSVGPGTEFYESFMRPETSEFKSGYGCLFSVELDSIETTVAFYDGLHVHQGPHLGANLTLAIPYIKALHSKESSWVEECGLNERMIRISVGVEDTKELVGVFQQAVDVANQVKKKDPLDRLVNPVG